ncbi:MAG TPA: hypothetical protein VFZ40_17945 [Pyrinomonadaceae bacterium]
MTYRTLGAFSHSNFRIFFIAAVLLLVSQSAPAQTSAFNYNGRLADNGTPVNGSFQFEFKLYGVPTGGASLATLTDINATVADGVFNLNLDFGGSVFDGNPRYLEIGVRPQGSANPYTTFTTRQLLTSVPYTIRSGRAATAEGLSCNGCVTDANVNSISGSKVTGPVASATNAASLGGQPAAAYILAGGSISATGLTLTGNGQIIAPRVENLTADPEVANASNRGRIYYNTASSELKMSNGSSWQVVGSNTTIINQTQPTRSPLQIATLAWWETNLPVTYEYVPPLSQASDMVFTGEHIFLAARSISGFSVRSLFRITPLNGQGEGIEFSGQLKGLAFDGRYVWSGTLSSTITRFDVSVTPQRFSGNFGMPFVSVPFGMMFDGEFVWTTWENGHVTKLARDGGVLCNITGFSNPKGIAFDGNDIWVANYGNNTVSRIERACETQPSVQNFSATNKPYGIAFDGTHLWVTLEESAATPGGLLKLNINDGSIIGNYGVGTKPHGLAFDGTNIWVANSGSNSVTKLRANSGVLVGTYAVGTSPEAVVFDGDHVWVSNKGTSASSVTRF